MNNPHKTAMIAGFLMLLAGCNNVGASCRSCIGHDVSKPVAVKDVAKIKIITGDTLLPKSATNVYFSEECGIDCSQQIRFDMPSAEARIFAEKLAGTALVAIKNASLSAAGANSKLTWWPAKIEKAMSASNEEANPVRAFVVPNGDKATVYIHSFSM